MILLESDWLKYPGAIVHKTTKNESFLRVATIFSKLGVKNSNVILALHNPELEHLDTRDPNLTRGQIEAMTIEGAENPWYLLREVLRAPPASGPEPQFFKASVANIIFYWLFFMNVIPYLIQPRQTGKSFGILGLIAMAMTLAANHTNITLITTNNTLRAETMVTFRKLIHWLPYWLQLQDKKDIDNTEKFTINAVHNAFRIIVARASEEDADSSARGLTSAVLGGDEIAYIKNNHITFPTALSTTGAARDNARDAGGLYGIFFATTAGKLHTKSGRFAYKMYRNAAKFSYKFFDVKNREALLDLIDTNSLANDSRYSPVVVAEFNHRQLEKTDEWLKERIAIAGATGVDVLTDYFNQWVSSDRDSLLTDKEIDIVNKGLDEAPHVDIEHESFMLKWYVPLMERAKYTNKPLVIGCDTSDGAGNDSLTVVLTDPDSGAVIATGEYNEVNLITFGNYLVHLLVTYKKSVLVIERQSSATTILDHMFTVLLSKGINPVKRIFNTLLDQGRDGATVDEVTDGPLEDLLVKRKGAFGFKTSGAGRYARSMLFGSVMKSAIRLAGDKIKDKIIITQMVNLTIRNNRIDHAAGSHDDLLIAYLLTEWFLLFARNKAAYGINTMTVLQNTRRSDETDKIDKRAEVLKKNQELADTIKRMKESSNPATLARAKLKIGHLMDKIGDNDITTDNIIARKKLMDYRPTNNFSLVDAIGMF